MGPWALGLPAPTAPQPRVQAGTGPGRGPAGQGAGRDGPGKRLAGQGPQARTGPGRLQAVPTMDKYWPTQYKDAPDRLIRFFFWAWAIGGGLEG